MKIGMLWGTGRMGRGISRGYLKNGHEIFIGSRDPEKGKTVAGELEGNVQGGSLKEAAAFGEIVFFCGPFSAVAGKVEELKGELDGKVLVDITNPFGKVPEGQTSGIEENAKSLPSGRWVAAYKTNFFKTLDQPQTASGLKRDVFIAADDGEAKKIVTNLIEETGFRPVDCGPLEKVRTIDLMVPLMLELDDRLNGDVQSFWKFVVPEES